MSKSAILLISFLLGCNSTQLPSFIKKCPFDAFLPRCVLDQANDIKPYFKDGIKELGIPKLVPFHLESLLLQVGKYLPIELANIDVFDLDTFDMTNVTVDVVALHGSSTLYFEEIHINGTYAADGKILVLPIKGHGPFSITINQLDCEYSYDIELYEWDNETYINFTHGAFDFHCGNVSMQLDNLFSGDKILGDQINVFLNENWKEVEELLRGPVSSTVLRLIAEVYAAFVEHIPMKDLFDISNT